MYQPESKLKDSASGDGKQSAHIIGNLGVPDSGSALAVDSVLNAIPRSDVDTIVAVADHVVGTCIVD